MMVGIPPEYQARSPWYWRIPFYYLIARKPVTWLGWRHDQEWAKRLWLWFGKRGYDERYWNK